jgi:hypothetical protein
VALHLVNTGMSTGQHVDGVVSEAFRAFHPGGRFESTGRFQMMPAEEGFNVIRAHRERAQGIYSQYAEGHSSLMMACHLQNASLYQAHSEGVRLGQWRYAGIGAHLYDVAERIQPASQVVLDYSGLLTLWSLYGDRWAHVLSVNYERVWISAKLLGILTWEYDLLRSRGQADRYQADKTVRDVANQLYTKLRMLPHVDPENGQDVIGQHTETVAARERDLLYLQEHITDEDRFPGIHVVGLRAIADALVADGRISPQLKGQMVQHARNPLPAEQEAAQRLTPGSDIVTGISTLATIALNGGMPALQAFLGYFGTVYYSESAWQRLQGDIEEYERLRNMVDEMRRLREQVGDAITSGLLNMYTAPASLQPFPSLDPEPNESESDRSQALDLLNTHVGYLNDVFVAGRAHSAPIWTDDRWTIKLCNGLAQDARPPDVFGTDSFLLWNRLRTADDAEYYDSYSKLVRWRYLGLPLNTDYLFWLVAEQGYAVDRGLVVEACAVYVQNVLHYVAPDTVLGAVSTDFKQELLDSYGQNFVVLLHKCYRANVPPDRVAALVRLLDLTRQNVIWEIEPYHYYACLMTEALAARGLELTIEAVVADGDGNDVDLHERVANEGLRFMRWVESVLLASGVPEKVLFDAKLDMMSY